MAKISKKDAKSRIEQLSNELREHNHNYYVNNSPTISDFEYDLMMQELSELERRFPEFLLPDSPTQVVGSDIVKSDVTSPKSFKQAKHKYPMLSLGNTYNMEEIYAFDQRISSALDSDYSYSCELKFDGTAICLTYKNGELVQALTRGDGQIGDDVIQNVLTIQSIPKHLKGDDFPVEFEIRGEIFMPYSAFDQLNSERAEIGEPLFANPRNAAAGSLKLLDSEEVRSRKLDAVFYHLLGENLPYTTHYEQLEAVKSWGLPVSEHSQICHSIDQVESYLVKWDSARKELPYATDGVVIKLNQIEPRESLGYTSKSPRWATAFKFKAERALTKILSVDYQVGRTGVITPVANLEPVLLSGTVVKRATLHNEDQMNILDIHEGDSVYIEKGGEIIPKIIEVELSQRVPNAQKVTFPTLCPDCETPLVKEEDDARYFCPNSDGCYSQIKERFVHFASRKAMNILAGDSTFEQLIKKLNVKELSDLYHLTKEQLLTLDSWKDRSAERFLKSIEESKDREFYRVLYSLGIRQIGESTAKLLTSHFKTIDAIAAASLEELVEIDEIGDIVAQSIIDYFSNDKNIKLITALKEIGLQFEEKNSAEKVLSEALLGKNIVISGNFSKPREEMKKLIVLHGGKSLSSISSKTDYLLSGTKSGPEKLRKAEQLGIEIITETQFFEMIK